MKIWKKGCRLSASVFLGVISLMAVSCGEQEPAFHDVAAQEGSDALSSETEDLDAIAQQICEDDHDCDGIPNGEDPDFNVGATKNEGGPIKLPDGTEVPPGYEAYQVDLTQTEDAKVDILWIIDNSGSMAEEQAYLGENFQSFITELASTNIDFQTAVTSTDICASEIPEELADIACPGEPNRSSNTHHRGDFLGDVGHKVLTHDDPELAARFQEYTDVGINGSPFEHGLKAVEMALNKEAIGENESFVRNDAFLSVIVVSDEEDDGIGLNMMDPYAQKNFVEEGFTEFSYTHTQLITYLNQVKGEANFSISAITGTRDSSGEMCTSNHSNPLEEGTQYITAADATGGIIQSICDEDWSESLEKIGSDLAAQIKQIKLAKKAFEPSIRVFVEGELVEAWSFVESINAIKFEAQAIPTAGQKIKIQYYGAP